MEVPSNTDSVQPNRADDRSPHAQAGAAPQASARQPAQTARLEGAQCSPVAGVAANAMVPGPPRAVQAPGAKKKGGLKENSGHVDS